MFNLNSNLKEDTMETLKSKIWREKTLFEKFKSVIDFTGKLLKVIFILGLFTATIAISIAISPHPFEIEISNAAPSEILGMIVWSLLALFIIVMTIVDVFRPAAN
jgi:hypothetical protein